MKSTARADNHERPKSPTDKPYFPLSPLFFLSNIVLSVLRNQNEESLTGHKLLTGKGRRRL